MYIGRIVWNRQRFIKDPDTGKRVSRLNPRADWVVQEVPELRIVEQDVWDAVKARQRLVKQNAETGQENGIWERRRARYLLSGLTRCGVCGGGFSMISASHVGCSTARNKGTCSNRLAIKRVELEERVLGALKNKLMDPTLFRVFCDEFMREMNRLRIEGRASVEAARSEIERIDRELDTLLNLILKGGAAERINTKMVQLEARKGQLVRTLAEMDEPPPLLHPEMATFYREQVTALHVTLGGSDDRDRAEAAERLQSLVSKIVLMPEDGKLAIDVHGDLAGILAIAHASTPLMAAEGLVSQAKPIAGTRRHHKLLNREGRPGGAADVAEIAQQVKLVAGVGFEPTTFRL
jgi:site-specific DNA recombinase